MTIYEKVILFPYKELLINALTIEQTRLPSEYKVVSI